MARTTGLPRRVRLLTNTSRKKKRRGPPKKNNVRWDPKPKAGEEVRFDTDGPPSTGYTFVPKGNVYVTRNCRLQTRQAERMVYVVYTAKSPRVNVQIGLYIPLDIHTSVTANDRETAASRSAAVAQKDARDSRNARALLEREFPSMPEKEVGAVLDHAFRKGSRRVGRSGTVRDEETKVRLAVEAHIRHVHTEYDLLLEKGVEKVKAREEVWQKVKEVKASWQGDG